MSVRYTCDYPKCENEAVVRIFEEWYSKAYPDLLGQDPPDDRSLDACAEHRTITHPGWWCRA